LKLAYLSDHPILTTGFGTVSYYLLQQFHALGMDVATMGIPYHLKIRKEQDRLFPFNVFSPPETDPYGLDHLQDFLTREKPDIILICNEMNLTRTWISLIRKSGILVPVGVYRGVSADELTRVWREGLAEPDFTIAYTHFAAEVIRRFTGRKCPVLYHGVDRSLFFPYGEERRQALRRILGWESRFVVIYVGRNRQNKQQPTLLRAFSILKKMGFNDMLCYLHCMPVEDKFYNIGTKELYPVGHDLQKITEDLEIPDMVRFSTISDELHGVPHRPESRPMDEKTIPDSVEEMVLADFYNAADAYVHVSELETFGLPLLEAASCGLPIAYKNDNGVMNEVCGDVGFRLEPVRFDRNILTRKLGALSDANIAYTIIRIYETMKDSVKKEQERLKGIGRASRFSWTETGRKMAEILREAVQRKRNEDFRS